MARILVLYYSSYGHTSQMAEAVAEGVRNAGHECDIRRVPETAPPEVVKAINDQAGRLINPSPAFYNQPSMELAKRLTGASCFDRIFFANSGAEANEGAIKLARKFGRVRRNGAYKIITFDHSFHGRTLATMSASGKPGWDTIFAPQVEGFPKADLNDLDSVRALIDAQTVAIMLEPVQGEAGVIPATTEFMQALRKLADEHGLLLIVDEVQTGMGRCGKLFAYELSGVTPDIMTLGKGIGGGVPLAALCAREEVSVFEHGDQGGTYNGNPLMTAAGVAVFDTLTSPGFLDAANIRYVVSGVMPPGFAWPDSQADAWTPFVASAAEREQELAGGFGTFHVAARLAPGTPQDRLGLLVIRADRELVHGTPDTAWETALALLAGCTGEGSGGATGTCGASGSGGASASGGASSSTGSGPRAGSAITRLIGAEGGRQPNPGTKMPYFQATSQDWWDEDARSPTYNTHVRGPDRPSSIAENLYDSGPVYDYAVKHALATTLKAMAADGKAVLIATHDVEFVAQVADAVTVLADGEVVSSGDVRSVVAQSPAFAPQVTKVLGPPWLRVDEVARRLGAP